MNHLVLLGDSIFDNASYVNKDEAVINHLLNSIPSDFQVSLLAVDGDITSDVHNQLKKLPNDTTHLIISCGGNDALRAAHLLEKPAKTVAEAMSLFAGIKSEFQAQYHSMLAAAKKRSKKITVCTIYNSVPTITPGALTALAIYNDAILAEAFSIGVPVIDLRLTCNDAQDYSPISPIEPSKQGGLKISERIIDVITSHDFHHLKSSIYY